MNVKIKFTVEKLKVGIELNDEDKSLEAVLQMRATVNPSDIARVLNLAKNAYPLECVISSPQSAFDLLVQKVDSNGEIMELKEAKVVENV